jgi:putative transposase
VDDVLSRECLAIEPARRFGGAGVVNVLSSIAAERTLPRQIHCDSGSELSNRLVDHWTCAKKVVMEFYRPGRPTDSVFIECTFRDEYLNVNWFDDLTGAKIKLQVWQQVHNESRFRRSLNEISPLRYKVQWSVEGQKFADIADERLGTAHNEQALTLKVEASLETIHC